MGSLLDSVYAKFLIETKSLAADTHQRLDKIGESEQQKKTVTALTLLDLSKT